MPRCRRSTSTQSPVSESGLVHSVVGTAANVADVTQVDKLLHGEENMVSGDAGYTGVEKRAEHVGRSVIWQIAAAQHLQATEQAQPAVQGQA